MTNYYKYKRDALSFMEDRIKKLEKILVEEILYLMSTRFGFSERAVEKHLNLLQDNGFIVMDGSMIRWVKKEVPQETKADIDDKVESKMLLNEMELAVKREEPIPTGKGENDDNNK